MEKAWVIGVDYGTDSVRSVIVDTADGKEIAESVFYYPRWQQQQYCKPAHNIFRQHPLDYVEGLEHTIKEALSKAGTGAAGFIKGISVDTTGSTPVAVDASGTPLALLPGFEENPNAMFVLWKDHSSIGEAEEINAHAQKFETNYLQFVGGIYSSEWFWAKLLHILRKDEAVAGKLYTWVEHCDWIPFLLTGGTEASHIKRGVCAAGHKALWAKEFGGYPPNDFFSSLDARLDGFVATLGTDTYTADTPAGTLCQAWAERLGLSTEVVIGIGAFDAHMGAVGGQIEPYYLSKVMGTSTCDMLVAPMQEVAHLLVEGICGQVPGSVVPGMMGMEAGQSAFGDVYAWFGKLLAWPTVQVLLEADFLNEHQKQQCRQMVQDKTITALSNAAAQIPLTTSLELATDWLNGRRTPNANQLLKASVSGLSLGTDAPAVFRALAEATCFGAKAIVERFVQQGVPVKGLIGLGGVARKASFIMQMMADVMNMPIKIHRSQQTCAVGAAMFAATAAGVYGTVEQAMQAMGQGFDLHYEPNAERAAIYAQRYEAYKALGQFTEQQIKEGAVA